METQNFPLVFSKKVKTAVLEDSHMVTTHSASTDTRHAQGREATHPSHLRNVCNINHLLDWIREGRLTVLPGSLSQYPGRLAEAENHWRSSS